jgi:ATP-dependent RNA helicase HelY
VASKRRAAPYLRGEKNTRRPAFVPDAFLRPILGKIGQPHSVPFRPDPFQVEALGLVKLSDTLVCAPTGAGKTWIAVEGIAQRLTKGMCSWYASPLKALSNAKYEEFCQRFGRERVGILTGDRKENADAQVVVATTEILRNHLYDAMDQGQDLEVDLVVIDEAHYLNDLERGVVWEEVLIYLPARVRILMLSATIGNPKEICKWLEAIRGKPCELVEEVSRPVPLYPLFLQPDGRVGLLLDQGGLAGAVRRYLKQASRVRRRERVVWEVQDVVEELRGLGLLPAIVFLKSRADCDQAVGYYERLVPGESERYNREAAAQPFLEDHPFLRGHRHFTTMLEHGVAAHHAGHLPQWKLLVEQLMNMGCLDVIFATSTVAAGVDFPARTVVILQSDRYDGREFTDLTATELQQMTGRAGRRGKDKVGFALIVPGPYQDVQRIGWLFRARPERIRSQIQINFSMVLNLLLSHRPGAIRSLLQKSLAAFLSGGGEERPWGRRDVKGDHLYAGGQGRQSQLGRGLSRGRLFLHSDGSVHIAFWLKERAGKALCMAHRLDRKARVRKGRLVLKGVPLSQIDAVLDRQIPLPPEDDLEGMCMVLDDLNAQTILYGRDQELAPMNSGGGQGDFDRDGGWLWKDFIKHLQFLRDTGFVDEQDRLTADGRWASQLRLDHPILVAEAIRGGLFEGRSAAVLAGLIAPFVTDREREVFILGMDLEDIGDAFDALVAGIQRMRKAMKKRQFPSASLQFWPAAVLSLWAKGMSWSELCQVVALDEGDLVALIVRTADHIRQICALSKTHPNLVRTARSALQRIQREPAVYV